MVKELYTENNLYIFWRFDMGKILEAGSFYVPNIDSYEISSKIIFISTCSLSEQLIRLFSWGVLGIENQLKAEGIKIEFLPKVHAVITDKSKVTFEMDDDAEGSRLNLVFFPINRWEEKKRTDYIILGAILEEFCHHFWNIEDEAIVKRKVIDIMNTRIFNEDSQITIDYVYNEKWIKDYEFRRDNGLDLSDML